MLALTPDDPTAWTDRGGALYSLDRYEEALTSFDQALALTPDDPAAWFYRGSTLQFLGRYEEALTSFDRALALTPATDTMLCLDTIAAECHRYRVISVATKRH